MCSQDCFFLHINAFLCFWADQSVLETEQEIVIIIAELIYRRLITVQVPSCLNAWILKVHFFGFTRNDLKYANKNITTEQSHLSRFTPNKTFQPWFQPCEKPEAAINNQLVSLCSLCSIVQCIMPVLCDTVWQCKAPLIHPPCWPAIVHYLGHLVFCRAAGRRCQDLATSTCLQATESRTMGQYQETWNKHQLTSAARLCWLGHQHPWIFSS